MPIIADVRARSPDEFGEMIRHPGEEYAYVIEGEVELHTELYAPVHLKTGDSIYFDSGMGHVYVNVGKGTCRILSICSSPESQLIAAMRERPGEGDPVAPPAPPKRVRAARPLPQSSPLPEAGSFRR